MKTFTAILLASTTAANAQPTEPAQTADDREIGGIVLHADYGIGRNFSPRVGDIADAYVSQVALKGGLVFLNKMADGLAFGAQLDGMIGHNDGTTSEALGGFFFRLHHLAPGSPGFDDGVVLPGMNDGFAGAAPDRGAVEAGAPALQFGVDAYE